MAKTIKIDQYLKKVKTEYTKNKTGKNVDLFKELIRAGIGENVIRFRGILRTIIEQETSAGNYDYANMLEKTMKDAEKINQLEHKKGVYI